MKIRTYLELKSLKTFEERYGYLRLRGRIGITTFGFERYLNQRFYTSREWLGIRRQVILRDSACDLGIPGYEISSKIIIHHMNPISLEDFKEGNSSILDIEFLISTTIRTHQAIHFGDKSNLPQLPVIRRRGDTSPWHTF
jgi:hypothetical protein